MDKEEEDLARGDGARAERARIRRELLAWAESRADRPFSGGMDTFRAALDRIAPAEKG